MNTKMKKMISTAVLAATLLGATVTPASAASLSLASTINVAQTSTVNLTAVGASSVYFGNNKTTVDTFNGVPAYYKKGNHNTDSTYSCAAYVKRYYASQFGVSVSNMLATRTPLCAEAGYQFKSINVRTAKPGDVLYHTNSSGGGHWAIVKAVSGSGLTVIEQNYKKASATSVTINRVVSYGQGGLKIFRLYKNGKDMNGGSGSTQGGNTAATTPQSDQSASMSSYTSGNIERLMFDAELYYSLYPDLQKAFGRNAAALENHWKTYGIREGRVASRFFDARYYLAHETDVAKAYGASNYEMAYNHFLSFGFNEGRQGSAEFSVRKYVNGYADLKKAFGTNWLAGAWHYKNNGIAEGRQGVPGSSTASTNTANNSGTKDYSGTWAIKTASNYVINVQYASKQSDQAKVVVDGWSKESNEIFRITKYGKYYRISPKHAPNLALNAMFGKDAKAGQQLTLHTWQNGDDASLWSIEEVNGGVRIRNKANSKLVLDVDHGRKTVTGARINLWTQDNTGNQTLIMQRL